MEIFTKKLTSMDIEKGLDLPHDSNLEGLPHFQGARSIKLSTAVESAAGKPLAGEPLRIHCFTKSGRLAFTRGWCRIARDASLKSGDIVSFYKEVNESSEAPYKMRIRVVDREKRK